MSDDRLATVAFRESAFQEFAQVRFAPAFRREGFYKFIAYRRYRQRRFLRHFFRDGFVDSLGSRVELRSLFAKRFDKRESSSWPSLDCACERSRLRELVERIEFVQGAQLDF